MEDMFIANLVMKYPNIGSILLVIGLLRLIFKPLMMLIARYVEKTAEKQDDEKFKEFKELANTVPETKMM